MSVKIMFDQHWQEFFLQRLDKDGPWSSQKLFNLAIEAEQHLNIPDFEGLVALYIFTLLDTPSPSGGNC